MADGSWKTMRLPAQRTGVAPDGSDVRALLEVSGGAPPLRTRFWRISIPVRHRTIEEIWYFLAGRGQMWRKHDDREEIVDVFRDVCLTIPVGTHFQFRSCGDETLAAIGATIPPWPGTGEAIPVKGVWTPTVKPT